MKNRNTWLVLGAAIAFLIYAMVVNVADVLVFAIFVYYIGRPIYDRLLKRFRSKAASAFISLFILLLPVTVVFLYGLGAAAIELSHLTSASNIPYLDVIEKATAKYSSIMANMTPGELMTLIRDDKNIQQAWPIAGMILFNAMGMIFKVMLMFTIALYLLMDGHRLRRWIVEDIYRGERDLADRYLKAVDADIHRVFMGNIFTAFFIAFMAGLVFSLLNMIAPPGMALPYPLLLAMVCGVTSLVPMIGVVLFWMPAIGVLAAWAAVNGRIGSDLWFVVAFAAATVVLVDWVPNFMFKPRVTGRRIHPGLMLMAYLLGPAAFGLSGLFLGPMILVVALNYANIVMPELRK
ncbi:MAG: AI-2E family transporter [Candidatus Altiarchaeota archaeon]